MESIEQHQFSGTIQKRRTTLKDVAVAANLSKSTVAAVLSGRGAELGIKDETRRLVRSIANQLHYRKNEIATQMKTSRVNMVALFIQHSDLRDYSFETVIGASMEAEKFGCYLKTVVISDESDFVKQLDYTIGQSPAALFHFGDPGQEAQQYLIETAQECGIPLAFIDFRVDAPVHVVLSDDRSGIRDAVRYLHSLGHQRIMHFTDSLRAQYAATRYQAFLDALHELGLPDDQNHLFLQQSVTSDQDLMNIFKEIFLSPNCPTAICCGNDYFALQALGVLSTMGIKVPDKVSIIGFGNLSLAQSCCPKLSTMGQSFEEIGRIAVRLTLSSNTLAKPDIYLQPITLIERKSTGIAPDLASLKEK